MTVTNVEQDREARTLTITSEFDAPVERVWQVWADPRQLERWWGPPTHPATFVEHDLTPGGIVTYFMTGPDGDRSDGRWRVLAVDAPNLLELEDADVDDDGTPTDGRSMTAMHVTLRERAGGGTTMSIRTTFSSVDGLDDMVATGVVEGFTAALAQLDALLGADVGTG